MMVIVLSAPEDEDNDGDGDRVFGGNKEGQESTIGNLKNYMSV